MTNVYAHQTQANLCQAVNTLGQSKPGKVVRFKREERMISWERVNKVDPTLPRYDTDFMTRESRHLRVAILVC